MNSEPARGAESIVEGGLVTVAAAAAFLSVARSTIYVLMGCGDLPFLKIGRGRRIPRRALVSYAVARLNRNSADANESSA